MQRQNRLFVLWFGCGLPLVLASPAFAQDDNGDVEPGPTIVNKGGVDVDNRSFGRVMADDTISSGAVVLGTDATPVAGPAVVPQIQTRGGHSCSSVRRRWASSIGSSRDTRARPMAGRPG